MCVDLPWNVKLSFDHPECSCTGCDAVRKRHAIPGALCLNNNARTVPTWHIHGQNIWGPSPDAGTAYIVIGPSIPGTVGHRSDAIVILASVGGVLGPQLTLAQWPTAVGIETRSRDDR